MAPPASRAVAAAPLAKELEPYRDLGIENLTVWLPTQPRGESLQFLDELHAEVAKLGWRVLDMPCRKIADCGTNCCPTLRNISPGQGTATQSPVRRMRLVTADRSAVGGHARLPGAVGRMCKAHHGCDLSERNASRVQLSVDVLGEPVWRKAPPEIVADELRHPDEGVVVVRRPSEAGGAQLSEVCVTRGIGSRNRSAGKQGSASRHGDGKSGQPAR